MTQILRFIVALEMGSFGAEAPRPSVDELETIAANISLAVEHYRSIEGLSDAESALFVECVQRVTPVPD